MYRTTESQFHNSVENFQFQLNHAISIQGCKQSILMEMQECLKHETNALQNQILFKSTHNYPYIYEETSFIFSLCLSKLIYSAKFK